MLIYQSFTAPSAQAYIIIITHTPSSQYLFPPTQFSSSPPPPPFPPPPPPRFFPLPCTCRHDAIHVREWTELSTRWHQSIINLLKYIKVGSKRPAYHKVKLI